MQNKTIRIVDGPDKDTLFKAFYHSCNSCHYIPGSEIFEEAYAIFTLEEYGARKFRILKLGYEDASGFRFLMDLDGYLKDDDFPDIDRRRNQSWWFCAYYDSHDKEGYIRVNE